MTSPTIKDESIQEIGGTPESLGYSAVAMAWSGLPMAVLRPRRRNQLAREKDKGNRKREVVSLGVCLCAHPQNSNPRFRRTLTY